MIFRQTYNNTRKKSKKVGTSINLRGIVMLCNICELNKKKCEQYWPEAVGQEVSYKETKDHVSNYIDRGANYKDDFSNATAP